MSGKRSTLPLVYALFFLSGISGLIYQIVWMRMLVLVFGNTMLATSTVLSAFMAGLAAGSYLLGRYVDRRPGNLLRLYALLEALIGAVALLFPLLLAAITPLYSFLYRSLEGNLAALNLVRFAICFVLISLPTFLMGGTLPVLLKRFAGEPEAIGRQTGFLYAINTAGAVVGTVACGYFLLRTIGMQSSVWVAVGINFAVAFAAWLLARRPLEAVAVPAAPFPGPCPERRLAPAQRNAVAVLVLFGIGVSGFCALAYEVFWTRMLNLFLNNNIYSFTAILATFLAGIAAGSFIYSRFLARIRDQVGLFVALEIGIGLLSYATPFVFSLLHGLFVASSEALTLVKTSLILIGPTILMGVSLPLAVQICQRGTHREGSSLGTVYAVNTMGAILGAFAAGFVLLPIAGLHLGVGVLAGLNVAAGLLPLLARARRSRRLAWAIGLAAAAAGLALVTPADHFRGLFEKAHPSADIVFYKEGKVANVVVYDFQKQGYKDLHLNAVEEASSRLWHVQLFKILGILPPLLHEEPSTALMIAFGAGISAGACIDQVSEFTCVDLNPDIDGPAEAFERENLDVIHHPRLRRVVNDGRNALLLSPRKFSLVISDATNPKMVDSWTLYSREFYELVKERLEPGGIFCQWVLIPLPGDAIKAILNTFRSVFPHMSFWAVYGSSQCLMLGTPERLQIDYENLQQRLEPVLESSGLRESGIDGVDKFLSFFLLGEDQVGELLAGFERMNTDDLPHAQFQVQQDEVGLQAALDLVRHQESILPYLRNTPGAAAGLEGRMAAYGSIARRLHLGFLTGNSARFQEAVKVADDAGLTDANVRHMLHFGPQRKRYFEERVARHPEDANAHNWLGFIRWKEGDLEGAIRELQTAITLEPDFAIAQANLARVLVDRGDLDGAAKKLLEVQRLNPTREVLRATARELEIVHLLRKLRYQPDSAELHRSLGIAYYNDGQILRAIEACRLAAARSPGDPDIQFTLARILENHEFLGEAQAAYGRLAEIAPQDPGIRAKQAEFTALLEDEGRQRSWLDARMADKPPEPAAETHPASCDRALAAWHQVDFEGSLDPAQLRLAGSLYEESISSRPDDLHAYVDAATIYEILGDLPKAAALWRGAAKVKPDWPVAGHHARRLERLEALTRQETGTREKALGLTEIGALYQLAGDSERSVEFARRAAETAPDLAAVWENLAKSLVEVGLYEEAVPAADRALSLDPGLQEAARIREAIGPLLEEGHSQALSGPAGSPPAASHPPLAAGTAPPSAG